jgi:hypothetical protein
MNQQQPIVIKQGMSIWGAIGWLLFFGLLFFVWQTVSPVNDVTQVFDTAVQTLEPISPQMQPQPGVIVLSPSTPFPTAVPVATETPAPTRPAIDHLPQGEGPYTVQQMQICRDVWAQSLQGELNTYQFGYCKGVVNR